MNRRQLLVGVAAGAAFGLAARAQGATSIKVYKTPTCGCCGLWIEHLEQAGFTVEATNFNDLKPHKARLGVPATLESCHTAEVGGYFVEGHVPAQDVKRLLEQRPDVRGIAVPGMPLGSPGMEVASGRKDRYQVILVARDGSTSVFAEH